MNTEILDGVNMTFRDEDSISDKIYENQIFRILL